ncbi:G patch domain-containing protein 8 isoform X2 [Pristis pectinata]|nr:G patch domain-containing protein 8 isoform X2 [Pristis pectinata]XP_051894443.1 G patch domain-containing protein 8 isoform X2 [Pristis pectinata]XP_051894444.1 G patch domain-containing protein 8 isoform X2 [Pristis pectinata]XP_051894445.1 G patch domain-containing protein 8 isoform X2 [Pristis pectinata]XP_051894446.1 G patch domain-containing protein 8 isoform X2 [Pristis pectinata]
MGMGRMEMELDYADDATERRRVMEVEKQDTEELRQKYKDYAEKEKAIAKALEDLRANFYCELCDKQYQKHHEFDNHINSYDHAHKQRLKDLKQREFARNVASRSRKDEKKQERALRRLHELAEQRKQQECAPGSGPMFKTTTVAVDEDGNDRKVVSASDNTGGKTSGPTSPSVNQTVSDNTLEDSRGETDNTSHCVTGSSAGLGQNNQPVQPFNISQLKSNSAIPLQKLGVSFSFAKKAPVKLDVSASVFSDVAEEPNESEATNPDEKMSSGQGSPKSMEAETAAISDKTEGASQSESDNDSINSTLSKLKKMMKKEDDVCQSEPEYYHYIPPAHCKVKPNFPFLLFMKATEESHKCGNKKSLETTKSNPDLQNTLKFQESKEGEHTENEMPALQQNSDTADGATDPDFKEAKSPETVSKQNCNTTTLKPIACEEGKQSSLANEEVLNGPKQPTGPFFPVLGKDESTTLQWPSELLMITKSEPCISYSCNPLYFEFKLTRNRDTKGKNKERYHENSHEQNAQNMDQDSQEKTNINTSNATSKTSLNTVGSEGDVKPQEQSIPTASKCEAQVGESDRSTNKKDKSMKSHKHKKKKKHKKSGKHLKEKTTEEKEKQKDGETRDETSKKRKKRKRKNKSLDEKSKDAGLELSVPMPAIKSTEESSLTQKKRHRSQDCQYSAATVEDGSRKENVSEEPISKKQKTGSCSELRKRISGRKDSRSRHRSRDSSRDEESDSYDESHRKRSRHKSSSRYSDDYDSRSDRSYSRRSRRHHSSSQRSSRRSYSSRSDVSSDCSRYSRRRSYSDSYSDYSDRSDHSKRSHDSDYDYRRSRHHGKKHKYSSSDDDYRRSRSRSRSSSRESTRTISRTRSRSRTRSSSHSRSRSKRRSQSTTQRSWKRSRSYSRNRRGSTRHRTSRRSISRDKGSHSHDSSGDRRSSRRNSSRSFSRDRVYRSKSPCYSRSRMSGKKDDYSKKEENKGDGTKSGSSFHRNLSGTSTSSGKGHVESERTPEERNSLTAKQLLEKIQSKKFEKKSETINETASTSNKVGIKLKDPPQGYFGPKLPPALGNKALLPLIGKLPTVKKPATKKSEDLCSEKGDKEDELYLAEPKDVTKEEGGQLSNWITQEEIQSREEKSDGEEASGGSEKIQTISCETQFVHKGFVLDTQAISDTYISDVSTPTEVITKPSELGAPDGDEAVMMHFAPDPEPFSNYIPQTEVQEIEEDSQEGADSSVAPLDRQPITFTPEEMEKYSKLQQAAQQHIQQQLLAKQVKTFPTSTAIAPAPTLQQFHIQQPSAAATATSITTVHHAILQHQAAAAAAMGIHPHAHPQTLAQIHHIPQPHLTPISLSHITPSIYPTHPATFLTSHPIHIIPASALHAGPLALHPVPHALYPALFAPRPAGAGASALHLHPFLHPIFSSQELQHPPSHGT